MNESSRLLLFLLSISVLSFFVCRALFGSDLDEILPRPSEAPEVKRERPKSKKKTTKKKSAKKKSGRRKS